MSGAALQDELGDIIAARAVADGYETMVFGRMPKNVNHVRRPDGRVEAAAFEPGDENGRGVMRVTPLGGNNSGAGRENAAHGNEYIFTLYLYCDAEIFTRNDVRDRLESFAQELTRQQGVNGEAQSRSQDPEITFISRDPEEFGGVACYYGTLTVGYVTEDSIEEV